MNSESKTRHTLALSLWAAFAFSTLPLARAIPQTQDVKGEVVTEKNEPISGAVCTLTGPGLSDQGLSVTTGEKGEIEFAGQVPGNYDLRCAAAGYEPVAKKGIEVTVNFAPFVQMVLPTQVVVREKVEVQEKAPTIAQQSAAPPATLNTQQLKALPLIEQKFKAALPLIPGVVRTPDGRINIKGVVENQGLLLVDSAETVDPVTGSFSIGVPIDAIESLEVHKATYRAEYGRFSGGLTSIQTKPPSPQWHVEVNDVLPTLRFRSGHLAGISDDSPRLVLTGPLWANKLSFSEFFNYDLNRQPVRGLAWPHNETRKEGFDSFSSFQYVLSSQHLLTGELDFFPQRRQFADINSLVPQSASSDYAQRGYSLAATDRYMLPSGGILTTLVKYLNFSSNAHGQGPQEMLVTPNGWGGNFFNAWTRDSNQEEILQNYQFPQKAWHGKHFWKVGGDFVHRSYNGTSQSHPVRLLETDGSLAEQIDFLGPGSLSASDTEAAVFAQDHWAASERLALDLGLRYSGQTLGDRAAFAPRIGAVYSPDSNGKTIFRSGFGVFYDRLPLLAGDFTSNLTRVVTCFDPVCGPQGVPIVLPNAYVKVDEKGRRIIPPGNNLASTPHNLTWNLEIDRQIDPRVVVRLSYLSSRTYDVFVVEPQSITGSKPVLLLTNTGGSRYHEFESTLRLHASDHADFNLSYVRSLARGDLNTLSQLFVPFEQPVIRPNYYADLPSNIPHRVITWALFRVPWKITLSPVFDIHSGFPYSNLDVLQNYVGAPNSQRFPTFVSLDFKLSKDFHLPLVPWLKRHTFRGGFQIFNITDHTNPRDVFYNIASPYFGHFVGFQHRLYDASFDIIY